jgi:hypothetical protein
VTFFPSITLDNREFACTEHLIIAENVYALWSKLYCLVLRSITHLEKLYTKVHS